MAGDGDRTDDDGWGGSGGNDGGDKGDDDADDGGDNSKSGGRDGDAGVGDDDGTRGQPRPLGDGNRNSGNSEEGTLVGRGPAKRGGDGEREKRWGYT